MKSYQLTHLRHFLRFANCRGPYPAQPLIAVDGPGTWPVVGLGDRLRRSVRLGGRKVVTPKSDLAASPVHRLQVQLDICLPP